MDLGTLTLGRAVLHQVGKRQSSQPAAAVVLSEAEAILSDLDKIFILDRLVKALQNHAVSVVSDGEAGSGAELIGSVLANPDSLVPASQGLALRLAQTQHGLSPEGLLLTGEVTDIHGVRGVLVAKLEHEQGIQAVAETTSTGLNTYSVSLIPDLLLSDAGKVYKVALFPVPQATGPMEGQVVDRQAPGRDVARYFLELFLVCRLKEQADVVTERFFGATQKYIARLEDASQAAGLQVALLTEMQANTNSVNPVAFARRHLPPTAQDAYLSWLREQNVPPRPFAKDTGRIGTKISLVRIDVEGSVTVLAPAASIRTEENPDGSVTVESAQSDTITIRGHVTNVSGGRRRGQR
jgi:hypothetical protein